MLLSAIQKAYGTINCHFDSSINILVVLWFMSMWTILEIKGCTLPKYSMIATDCIYGVDLVVFFEDSERTVKDSRLLVAYPIRGA